MRNAFVFALSASAWLIAGLQQPARADVLESFTLGSIALQNGGTLSGTFTFDETTDLPTVWDITAANVAEGACGITPCTVTLTNGDSFIHDDGYITDPADSFGFQSDAITYTFRLFFGSDFALGPDQLTKFDYNAGACGNVCFTFPSEPATAYADPVTAVPEPASLALLGSGLFGLGLRRRRRKG